MRRFGVVALCAVGLAVLAGCDDDTPVAEEPSATATTMSEPPEPLRAQDGDTVLAAESGTGRMKGLIVERLGPKFHLYAKCTGGGKLLVVDRRSEFRWSVHCDGVDDSMQVHQEKQTTMALGVVATPEIRWEFLVAEPLA